MRLIGRIRYTVCYGPTCKGKKTFKFAGGGSEGQKKMCARLPIPTFFRIKVSNDLADR